MHEKKPHFSYKLVVVDFHVKTQYTNQRKYGKKILRNNYDE